MILSCSASPARTFAQRGGFSIIEVTVALGIIGLALIAIVGLLPTGLQTHSTAQEEARATSALNMVTSAAESLHYYNPLGSANPTWAFPHYFSDNPDPVTNPTMVWVTQAPWSFTFFVSDGGMIIPTNDTTTRRRQTLHVHVYPPQTFGQPVKIYAAIAWPYQPTDTSSTTPADMGGRQGFIDTLVTFTPTSLH